MKLKTKIFRSGACVGQFPISPPQLSSPSAFVLGRPAVQRGEGEGGGNEGGANTPFDTTLASLLPPLSLSSLPFSLPDGFGLKCDIIVTLQINALFPAIPAER